MSKIWSYIAIFFAGVTAGFMVLTRIKKTDTVINAETYVDDQVQKIGKIKQKGQGNKQDVQLEQKLTRKEIRKQKKLSRKTKRISRKSK